jgi:ornithine cyclodeaminase/alanine dehydrogenase-like protein (mu-crystallin family)
MARQQSRRVGLIGAGRQAVAQLMALESVGLQDEVCVYARRREQGFTFCEDMSKRLKASLRLANSAEEAICDADIVVTATTSSTPVFNQDALKVGAHINTIGANSAARMELDPALIQKATLLASDDLDQARTEAAEFIALGADFDWRRLQPLSSLVRPDGSCRGETDLTIFKSLGAGLEDLAVASLLYDRLQQS